MPERTLNVVNRLGLHARAAARFVSVAARFTSRIEVTVGDRCVNGKSILGLMTLAAARGAELRVRAEGADADAALDALSGLVRERFGEDG